MSIIDDLVVNRGRKGVESVRRERPGHPQGWEPGIAWDGRQGTITSRPLAEPDPKWEELLKVWGFDPDVVEIVEPVQVRTWDATIASGEVRTMWYYRAGIRAKRTSTVDLDELIREIRRRRPRQPAEAVGTGELAYVTALSDWQLGKPGTQTTVDRILEDIDSVADRLRELRRAKVPIGPMYALSLGDLIEGCRDHYPMQTFEVELDKRSQVRLARRLLVRAIQAWAPLIPRLVVAGVGGNHGEHRLEGRAFTSAADNADVEALETAAEVISAGAFPNVSFVVPEGELALTLDVAGVIVGLAHGHKAAGRGGKSPQEKIREWWRGQAFGMQPVGDARILFTGHWHHLSILSDGGRTHIQVPSLETTSPSFTDSTGIVAPPATVTLLVGAGAGPGGWNDLRLV